MKSWDLVWCYFRNALHSAYREIRHLGPRDDPQARATAPAKYAEAARMCRANRAKLRASVPYRSISKHSTKDYVNAYRSLTGLGLTDLKFLFNSVEWQPRYGGKNWEAIVDAIIALESAINMEDLSASTAICQQLSSIRHNSGPLIPSQEIWENEAWQRQKWPELCEEA